MRNTYTQSAVLNKLKHFSQLEYNWNGYGAQPISKAIINQIIELIPKFKYIPEVFPLATAGIQLEWEFDVASARPPLNDIYIEMLRGLVYVELTIEEDGVKVFMIDDGYEMTRHLKNNIADEINELLDIINSKYERILNANRV